MAWLGAFDCGGGVAALLEQGCGYVSHGLFVVDDQDSFLRHEFFIGERFIFVIFFLEGWKRDFMLVLQGFWGVARMRWFFDGEDREFVVFLWRMDGGLW